MQDILVRNAAPVVDIPLFRPSQEVENLVYSRIKTEFFAKYSAGYYTDRGVVKEMVNFRFTLFASLMDEQFVKLDMWELAVFLQEQYELYAQAEKAYKLGQMSEDDECHWREYSSLSRRGIKFLLEMACQQAPAVKKASVSVEVREEALGILFIAAEEMVQSAMRSDYYAYLLDEITLTLDPAEHTYFSVPQDTTDAAFDPRQDQRDALIYIPGPPFERNLDRQDVIMGEGFAAELGARYRDIVLGLRTFVSHGYSGNPDVGVGCLRRDEAIDHLVDGLGVTAAQAEVILAGFSLTRGNLTEHGRVLHKPRQEYRARRRAFFVFTPPDDEQEVLLYSRAMVQECLELLVTDMAYQTLAPEWKCPAIVKELNHLNDQASKWFERTVAENLSKLDIRSLANVKQLTFKGGRKVRVPDDVGEIDLLAYSPRDRLVLVIEAKQVQFSSEPRMYMQDLDKFIEKPKSYARQFEVKYRWVTENLDDVCLYLSEQLKCPVEGDGVGYAMVTHHPLLIATRITGFSCVNLSQFMRGYKAEGQWALSRIMRT